LLVVVITIKVVLSLVIAPIVILLLPFVLLPLPAAVLNQHVVKLSKVYHILKSILLDELLEINKVFVNCVLAHFYELRKLTVHIKVVLTCRQTVTVGQLNIRNVALELLKQFHH
jgi:hypothetical protein